jgi:hypothetical protein
MQDRRKFQREVVNQPAMIRPHDGSFERLCLIADMSDGGIRLVSDSPVPDEFVLAWNGAEGETRQCRVVWRLDNELGAEFVDIGDDDPA